MKAQRLRFRYRLRPPASDLRVRELTAAWVQALSGAGLSVAMSEGKRPAPQVSLAATLTQGATSEFELADVFLAESVDPASVICRIAPHLSDGLDLMGVSEVGVNSPSLQSQLRWAEYEVDTPANGISVADAEASVERVLSATALPAEYRRETKVRHYDLRPLILDLRLAGRVDGDTLRFRMRLRAEQENTARADQVVLALGLPPPVGIKRTRLGLEEVSAVLRAYRRSGERVEY